MINNTLTPNPKQNNVPLAIEELIATLQNLPNLFCVVTCQREGAPYIYDELVRTLDCFVIDLPKHIISASEQAEESVVAEYRKLHQSPDFELRTLGIILHYYPNINRIFKKRGTKRRSAKERRDVESYRRKVSVLIESLAMNLYLLKIKNG